MTYQSNLFKVYFRMSDGQVFEREFRSYTEATRYIYDVKGLKTLFCIEDKTLESATWINPKQIVSAEVTRYYDEDAS